MTEDQKMNEKRVQFEQAIMEVFTTTFKQQFLSYKEIILFERDRDMKKEKTNVWAQIGEKCGITGAAVFKYYNNTWTKYHLEPWDDDVRSFAIMKVTNYTIQHFKIGMDDDQKKKIRADIIQSVTDEMQLQSKQYIDRHYETLYHAMYSKINSTIAAIERGQPPEKIMAQAESRNKTKGPMFDTSYQAFSNPSSIIPLVEPSIPSLPSRPAFQLGSLASGNYIPMVPTGNGYYDAPTLPSYPGQQISIPKVPLMPSFPQLSSGQVRSTLDQNLFPLDEPAYPQPQLPQEPPPSIKPEYPQIEDQQFDSMKFPMHNTTQNFLQSADGNMFSLTANQLNFGDADWDQ